MRPADGRCGREWCTGHGEGVWAPAGAFPTGSTRRRSAMWRRRASPPGPQVPNCHTDAVRAVTNRRLPGSGPKMVPPNAAEVSGTRGSRRRWKAARTAATSAAAATRGRGGRWRPSGRSWCCWGRVDDRDGDQGDAEVTDLGEQPVQFGLVGDGSGEAGAAVVLVGQGEAAEPRRPVLVEPARNPQLVDDGTVFGGWVIRI